MNDTVTVTFEFETDDDNRAYSLYSVLLKALDDAGVACYWTSFIAEPEKPF